jgi:3'(2'), 5'-bisphosphate nucleotidase
MIDLESSDLRFAVAIARRSAALAKRIQAGVDIAGQTKSDYSPVTVADYAIQAIVGHALEQTFSGAVLVAEERADMLRTDDGAAIRAIVTRFVNGAIQGATEDDVCAWIDRGAAEPEAAYWTLDPIDGTKGYLRGGQYAVALARIEHGRVTLGVLGCPGLGSACEPDADAAGVLLVAKRSEGAWRMPLGETQADLQRLTVSTCADPSRARLLRSYEAGHTNVDQISQLAQHINCSVPPVPMDSQAKYAVLAAGGGEALFRFLSPNARDYKEKIWDQAAGSIILEEAGGRITDLDGRPLDFTRGRMLTANRGVVASNGLLHDALLAAVAAVQG